LLDFNSSWITKPCSFVSPCLGQSILTFLPTASYNSYSCFIFRCIQFTFKSTPGIPCVSLYVPSILIYTDRSCSDLTSRLKVNWYYLERRSITWWTSTCLVNQGEPSSLFFRLDTVEPRPQVDQCFLFLFCLLTSYRIARLFGWAAFSIHSVHTLTYPMLCRTNTSPASESADPSSVFSLSLIHASHFYSPCCIISFPSPLT
jgi:hypothetical protein